MSDSILVLVVNSYLYLVCNFVVGSPLWSDQLWESVRNYNLCIACIFCYLMRNPVSENEVCGVNGHCVNLNNIDE